MQRTVHRLMAALGVLALALSTFLCATPAFAAGSDGTITVTSANPEFKDKTITVYQMFNETGADGSEQYVLAAAWESFFTTGTEQGGVGLSGTGYELSDAAYTYVKNLGKTNDQAVSDFAKKAAAWAADDSHSITGTPSSGATGSGDPATYTAQVTGLAYGYYLVIPQTGSTPSTEAPYKGRGTDAMLVNVNDSEGATQQLKSVYPTVDKKVDENANHASASVGDTLVFTLTSTVPDISEYTQGYQFSFVDTLSKGLTFNEGSVQVKIGEEDVTSNCTIVNPSTGNNVLTIHFGTQKGSLSDGKYDATSLFTNKAGQTITVTYTATLNENAQVQVDQTNTVKVVYSNDPTTNGTGESGESKTHQYTFGFDLKKTDGTNPLADAHFKLQDSKGTDIMLVSAGADTYRPAKTDEMDGDSATTEVTTPEGGVIHFTGLAEGTYQLVETEAPQGYNKVTDPIEVKIEASYNEDGTLKSWSVNKNGQNAVKVVNHAGTLLPGTGGIGTVVFTVAGAAIVIAGAAWYIGRRKQQN